MIVFPAIDLRQGRVVRLRQGETRAETVYADDPAAVARQWVAQGAEWLHVVDLDGALNSSSGRQHPSSLSLNLQRLREIRAAVPETPIQFGGGLRTMEDMARALELGATRVVLGTIAVQDPDRVAEAVRRFGAERVAVALDAREGRVATHGWQKTSEIPVVALGRAMRDRGVRYALYTDILRDGMLTGIDVMAIATLARATGLQVIASGGVATLDDVRRLRAYEPWGVIGVIIGQALYSGTLSLTEALHVAQGQAPPSREELPPNHTGRTSAVEL
ncbi:MAG: 1-(5-phosphoribosyl)-5-[(5-phosphoribosylamino)methylideneamino]imidazole-4-carboxamide isomerase [Anaerolineae bacterium]|nr:1-(5-phosphoribosyl)-5-[(5-phosphoribosylamino)methylideneamino]imidazole-4-carboxamide isomerase [Anaerolineae bacterium]MDW8069290.1 1-(5-phosphoribosyl)-5-[(5-phosphoribosylamino)methylideneamino]imidazole-4-carboxamide isomerase [Anaerolineae bacterium]